MITKTSLGNIKPSDINDEIWSDLKKLEVEMVNVPRETASRLSKIQNLELEVIPLIDKIEKQFAIINEVLNDPTALNRIEDYNNTFSAGNFENLKKIAQLKFKKE